MMVKAETKEAVLREIAKVIRDANKAGDDGMKVAEEKFPGTPYMVIIEANVLVEMAEEAMWWEQVESTIDGELAQKAIIVAGKGGEA